MTHYSSPPRRAAPTPSVGDAQGHAPASQSPLSPLQGSGLPYFLMPNSASSAAISIHRQMQLQHPFAQQAFRVNAYFSIFRCSLCSLSTTAPAATTGVIGVYRCLLHFPRPIAPCVSKSRTLIHRCHLHYTVMQAAASSGTDCIISRHIHQPITAQPLPSCNTRWDVERSEEATQSVGILGRRAIQIGLGSAVLAQKHQQHHAVAHQQRSPHQHDGQHSQSTDAHGDDAQYTDAKHHEA